MAKELTLDIARLEDAFEMLGVDDGFGDYADFPNDSYLDLTTGELIVPETHEVNEALCGDKNLLRLEALESDGYATMKGFVHSLDDGPPGSVSPTPSPVPVHSAGSRTLFTVAATSSYVTRGAISSKAFSARPLSKG